MSAYRSAGIFLLLTALATAISVPARLAADADATPLTDSLAQRMSLDAVEIARLELSEKLRAVGSADVAYGIGGAARLVGGLTLLAAAIPLWRAMRTYHSAAMGITAALLASSGIASALSGAAAIGLAVLAPDPQTVAVLGSDGGLGWARIAQPGDPESREAVMLPDVRVIEETLFSVRWVTGTLGFTLAGLALVTLAPVQWRMDGAPRVAAVAVGILGAAMLFIWVDAATVVHRITGIAFLVWLILAGLWLIAGRIMPRADQTPTP